MILGGGKTNKICFSWNRSKKRERKRGAGEGERIGRREREIQSGS